MTRSQLQRQRRHVAIRTFPSRPWHSSRWQLNERGFSGNFSVLVTTTRVRGLATEFSVRCPCHPPLKSHGFLASRLQRLLCFDHGSRSAILSQFSARASNLSGISPQHTPSTAFSLRTRLEVSVDRASLDSPFLKSSTVN